VVRIGLILTGLLVAIASAEGQRAAPRPARAPAQAAKSPYSILSLAIHPLSRDGAGNRRNSIDGGVQLRLGASAAVEDGISSGPAMVLVDIGGPVDGVDYAQISYSSQLTLSLVELDPVSGQKPVVVKELATVQIADNMVVELSPLGGRPTQFLPFLIFIPVSCGPHELRAAVSGAPGAPAVNQRTFKFYLDACGN